MTEAAFDTHAYFKRLTAAGMPEAQAEVIAHERARRLDELVTKTDLEKELQLLENRMTINFGLMLIGFTGILVAVMWGMLG
ncbi:MAG: CCDC90 family protein [Gammaproteobacteria bacterium]|nr:CCDC90 family protein [Gammaproteobacteria bacterium]